MFVFCSKDIIDKLLEPDPKKRLGSGTNGANGVQDIKNHPFFEGIDWEKIRKMDPPIVPDPPNFDMNRENVNLEEIFLSQTSEKEKPQETSSTSEK